MSNIMFALTLKESVIDVLKENPEVKAEMYNQKAYRKYIDEQEAGYYPKIDFKGYLESSHINNDSDDGTREGKSDKDGYKALLRLEQLLYDGGLTSAEVRKAKSQYDSNFYKTNNNIEMIILNLVGAYNGLVQYNELIQLTSGMVRINEDNLITAKEKEQISGEVLETYQVSSKLNFVREKLLEEETLEKEQKNNLLRFLGKDTISGYTCRPNIDFKIVPNGLEKAIEYALNNNNEILQYIQKIKEQKANISIADSTFLPHFNLELQGSFDDDLELSENGTQEELLARLNINWNLFSGGKDTAKTQREKIFLKEAKSDLDAITRKVVAKIKNLYFEYQNNKKRIDVLKEYVKANENIVYVYQEEFDAGTRTFVDILDAQTELYQSKKSLINREFELMDNYYNILQVFSMLKEKISKSPTVICKKPKPITILKKIVKRDTSNEDIESLLNE